MKNKFLEAIRKYSMFSDGDRVVVGLSGGADSMCLVSLLHDMSDQLKISVSAVHVNHCIRGEEADRDEQFVRNFCESANIPLTVYRKDIPAIAAEAGESIELAARRIRYECFKQCSADKIATAHSASDRIETLLFNLSRGASLKGLCSIPPVRDNIVRPLINITRSEIEEYCRQNNIEYITDSTNLTDEYTRNKYRLNVIPHLSEINPAFEKNALRCIELLNDENAYIDGVAGRIFEDNLLPDGSLNLDGLFSVDDCIFRRVITVFLEYLNISEYEYTHLSVISENKGHKFALCLPGNHRMESDGKYLYLKNADAVVRDELKKYSFEKDLGIKFFRDNVCFSVYVSDEFSADECSFVADAEKIGQQLCLRARASGDSIKPGRGRCTKPLRKLFNELKIPGEDRDYKYVLADENGVVFVESVGFDASRLCDRYTKKFLIIKVEVVENA